MKYIRRQARQLAKQLDGVRAAEDIEFVHRARVATRRLRASLAMFGHCFAPKRVKRWRKAIRRLTGSLGDARDRDVQIECLCGTLSALSAKECFPGVAHVLVQLEHDRERLQRQVVKAVRPPRGRPAFCERCGGRPKKALDEAGLDCPACLHAPEACHRSGSTSCGNWTICSSTRAAWPIPEDRGRHHAMRIAVKRLRYTLEISRPMCPGRLDEAVETVKRLQTLLGDVHDCDVWLDHLDAFASASSATASSRCSATPAGSCICSPASSICARIGRATAKQTFEELVGYWAELKDRRFADELAGAVDFDEENEKLPEHSDS